MKISFEKVFETVRFHSPLQNMEEVEHDIERRRDPLTGRMAIGSVALEGKGQFFFGPTDYELIEQVASATRENCFFCPEHLQGSTPRYTKNWLPEGALQAGECFLFPNLFPLSAVHAVVVLGEAHVRRLRDFNTALLRDGLQVSVDFARTLRDRAPENKWFTINSNYLFPAGASIVHPHLQVFGGRYPATAVSELLDCSEAFKERFGFEYFDQLVAQERENGERFVATSGRVHWLAPFAPVGTNEFIAVLPGCNHLLELTGEDIANLAEGLSQVLAYYDHIGFSTFNFTIYSSPLDGKRASFPLFTRVICRQNVRANYRTDDYFIQKLLGEELMLTTPETLAAGLREFW